MGKAFLGELPSEDELKPIDLRRELVGRVGVAKTKMLPSGSVLVDGHWLDAVAQGDAIEPGEPMVVVEVRGNRVVVRRGRSRGGRAIGCDPRDVLSKPLDELGFEGFDETVGLSLCDVQPPLQQPCNRSSPPRVQNLCEVHSCQI